MGFVHDRQLIAIDHGAAGRYAYARDAMGKLLRSTETVAGASPPHERTYQYDAADRLLGVSDDAGGPYSYTYDALDNRLSAQSPQAEQRAGYDALNQLSAIDGKPYTYDANGNLLDDGSRRYAWDAENRLIGIAYANGRPATALRYDGLGRRLAIVDASVLGSSETRFLWCGGPTPCQARDGNNRVLSRYYPHGEVRPSLGTYGSLYYVRDQLGSVRALRTRNGQTLHLPDYDPWGESGSFFGVDFRFAGMYYHGPSGLYLTPYRAYDPRIGRWLSRDPIGEEGGINLYGYVGGNPVSRIDPYGLWALGDPLPQEVVNAAAGFGDGVSFGLTNAIRNAMETNDTIDKCSSTYFGSKYAGYAWGAATLWAAGLNGGTNSVFWSGSSEGAEAIAVRLGTTLELTPIGRAMNYLANTRGVALPKWMWTAASATFSANADGTATAVILSVNPASVWATIEYPILSWRGIPILFH